MKALSLLLVMVCSAVAFAADSFDVYCADIVILQNRDVQADIGVTSQQRDQMNKLAQANREKLEAYKKRLGGKPPDAKYLRDDITDLKHKVVAVLSPAQVKRLRELNLQAAGLRGITDKVVAKKVGLTDAQYKKFCQVFSGGQQQVNAIMKQAVLPVKEKYAKLAAPYKGKEREHEADLKRLNEQFNGEMKAVADQNRSRIQAITDETQKKLVAVLTPQEKAAWTTLQGRRFAPPKSSK